MLQFRMTICLILALSLIMGCCVIPGNASEDPLAIKDYSEFGAAAPMEQEVPVQPENLPEEQVQEIPAKEGPVQTVSTEQDVSSETPDQLPVLEETNPVGMETSETEDSAEEQMTEKPEMKEVPEQPSERIYDTVPLYFQTDYPNVRFGTGTVSNNGCSVTSLAMVATYMTGHKYLPDELARYFGGRAENNIARLEMGSEVLKLPYHKAKDWNETYAALQAGKLVIVLVDSRIAFTQSQHFLILTGINKAGKIEVLDSYEPNYTKWELKQGFAEGFAPSYILHGYSGAWIYDPDAMPEEPYIYHEPQPDHSYSRYPEVQLTLEQEDLLAKVIWVESRGECAAGQQAVAEVVLNRLVSDKFPDNLHDVIYGEGQFRSVPYLKDAQPSQTQYEAIEKALYGPNILPMNVFYFATTPTTEKVWGGIGGHIFCYAEH